MLGSIPSAYGTQRFGPKRTLLLSGPMLCTAALLVGSARNPAFLFGGRFLAGIGTGIVFTVLPIYLSEIAAQRIRGCLCGVQTVLYKAGILVAYVLAPYVSLQQMATVAGVPAIVFALFFALMPESPYWLLEIGDRTAAAQSLQRLRGGDDVQTELADIERNVVQQLPVNGAGESKRTGFGETILSILFGAENQRSLWILVGTAAIVPLCGSEVLQEYAQIIITAIPTAGNMIRLDAVQTCILLAVVQLMAAIVGVCALDWLGRRPLLIGSAATLGCCTMVVMAYFTVQRWDDGLRALNEWRVEETMAVLAVVALIVFQAAYNVGLETVLFTLNGELWPLNVKALLSAAFVVVEGSVAVAVGKLFQVVSDRWGSDVPFAVFSMCSFAFIWFVWRLVPETRNRSLCDIQAELRPQPNGPENVGRVVEKGI